MAKVSGGLPISPQNRLCAFLGAARFPPHPTPASAVEAVASKRGQQPAFLPIQRVGAEARIAALRKGAPCGPGLQIPGGGRHGNQSLEVSSRARLPRSEPLAQQHPLPGGQGGG